MKGIYVIAPERQQRFAKPSMSICKQSDVIEKASLPPIYLDGRRLV